MLARIGRLSRALKYNSIRTTISGDWLLNCSQIVSTQEVRFKYTQNKGVKGLQNKKRFYEAKLESQLTDDETEGSETLDLDDREYDEIVNNVMNVSRAASVAQNVLVIQPYVKWGAKRNNQMSPEDQLREAEALVHSLPNWHVAESLKVPLESLDRKALFGTGKLGELKKIIQRLQQSKIKNGKSVTCVFVSKSSLTFVQKRFLEMEFNLPVMDRYSVVIQILRLHATSTTSRLQVAMAEIPYIWSQAKDANLSMSRKQGYALNDAQREILKSREKKLRNEIDRIRSQRKLLRNRRRQKNFPIVAVVGYTNAGKTSLIKELTNELSMQPRDQLFATLDVTAHAGMLPCNLEVIYMDTVGFMSDLPTGLIECFVATLEDAMLADVILHVHDISSECSAAQKSHVETTLQSLAQKYSNDLNFDGKYILPPIINVGNKFDLISLNEIKTYSDKEKVHLVSAKTKSGLNDLLLNIEQHILIATERQKLKMRVRNGGEEMAWLYKNAAVVDLNADHANPEMLLINVVITHVALQQFKRNFCQ